MFSRTGKLNDVYPSMVQGIMAGGAIVPSRNGETREEHPALVKITDPHHHLVTAVGRPVNVAFALAEVLWILAGSHRVDALSFFNSTISNYSDDGVVFNAAYGHRIRHAHGHDQLLDVIMALGDDPDSRQAIINIWHPKHDRSWERNMSTGGHDVFTLGFTKHQTKDRACNLMSHLMIRDGRLDWTQMMRSNDALWGVPYNWMQFTHLMQYVAAWLEVPMGNYYHMADSLHIYDYHWDEARSIRRFDLYQEFGEEHPVMPKTTDGMVLDMWQDVARIISGNPPRRTLKDEYWDSVIQVLNAHRLYSEGRNNQAMDALALCGDKIYGAAQMRFYWHHRWHKDGFEDIGDMIGVLYPESVAHWIKGKNEA